MKHGLQWTLTVPALLLSMVAAADVLRLSEPVAIDETSETFGAVLDESLPKMSLAELIGNAETHLDRAVLVETRVGQVCQKKGCFFVASDGDVAVRVSFRDYGFFVPTDSSAKTVTLEGRLVKRELTPAQAAHFNSDMRDGKATLSPGVVYEIVADGVRIPRSG